MNNLKYNINTMKIKVRCVILHTGSTIHSSYCMNMCCRSEPHAHTSTPKMETCHSHLFIWKCLAIFHLRCILLDDTDLIYFHLRCNSDPRLHMTKSIFTSMAIAINLDYKQTDLFLPVNKALHLPKFKINFSNSPYWFLKSVPPSV